MRQSFLPLDAVLALVLGGQALALLLMSLVFVRKLRRDRAQRTSLRRRAEFAAAIEDGSHAGLLKMAEQCVRDPSASADLLYVLLRGRKLEQDRLAAVLKAAQRSGLVAILHEALDARSPTVRGTAALALAALHAPGNETDIAQLLRDDDPDVRLAACGALASARTPESAEALIWALERLDLPPGRIVETLGEAWAAPTVRSALARSLRATSPKGLGATNGSRSASWRAQLAQALGLASYSEAEPELLALLDWGGEEERINAARALGRAGGSRSIPALVDALQSESWPLRAQAALALGRLGAVEAVPVLAARLSDHAWWVRKHAAWALRHLGPSGLGELQAALEHRDAYARDRAAEELELDAIAWCATSRTNGHPAPDHERSEEPGERSALIAQAPRGSLRG